MSKCPYALYIGGIVKSCLVLDLKCECDCFPFSATPIMLNNPSLL